MDRDGWTTTGIPRLPTQPLFLFHRNQQKPPKLRCLPRPHRKKSRCRPRRCLQRSRRRRRRAQLPCRPPLRRHHGQLFTESWDPSASRTHPMSQTLASAVCSQTIRTDPTTMQTRSTPGFVRTVQPQDCTTMRYRVRRSGYAGGGSGFHRSVIYLKLETRHISDRVHMPAFALRPQSGAVVALCMTTRSGFQVVSRSVTGRIRPVETTSSRRSIASTIVGNGVFRRCGAGCQLLRSWQPAGGGAPRGDNYCRHRRICVPSGRQTDDQRRNSKIDGKRRRNPSTVRRMEQDRRYRGRSTCDRDGMAKG